MTKEIFIQNFKLLLVHLKDITEELCSNQLSENYKFILEPSQRNVSTHLSEIENRYFEVWNKLENTEISFDEVVDLFYKNGTTPKWADCNVYLSTSDKTVVKIFFSRQFKDDAEIYYLERGTAPFKALVNTPIKNVENPEDKFDVNWKYKLERNKSQNIFTKLRKLWFK